MQTFHALSRCTTLPRSPHVYQLKSSVPLLIMSFAGNFFIIIIIINKQHFTLLKWESFIFNCCLLKVKFQKSSHRTVSRRGKLGLWMVPVLPWCLLPLEAPETLEVHTHLFDCPINQESQSWFLTYALKLFWKLYTYLYTILCFFRERRREGET